MKKEQRSQGWYAFQHRSHVCSPFRGLRTAFHAASGRLCRLFNQDQDLPVSLEYGAFEIYGVDEAMRADSRVLVRQPTPSLRGKTGYDRVQALVTAVVAQEGALQFRYTTEKFDGSMPAHSQEAVTGEKRPVQRQFCFLDKRR